MEWQPKIKTLAQRVFYSAWLPEHAFVRIYSLADHHTMKKEFLCPHRILHSRRMLKCPLRPSERKLFKLL